MLMNANGTDKRMIVIAPPAVDAYGDATGSLSWSPNGRWLTMDVLRCGEEPCLPQVFAYRTDGSDLFNSLDRSRQVNYRQATRDKVTGADAPQFCGNSSQILYESGNHAYLINRDGSHRQRTAIDTLQRGYPIWPVCVPPAGGGGPPPTVNVMRVTVPSVRTLSYTDAKRRLHRAGLHGGTVTRANSVRIRRGHVIAQYPRAGTHLHRSTRQGPPVKLVLSRGPRP